MENHIPSYPGKVFVIDDNLAVLRNPKNLKSILKYKEGELRPPNKKIKDQKIIPLNTLITVDDVKLDKNRNVYVHAVPVDAPDFVIGGWTRSTNLQGKFMNEIISYVPDEWDLHPQGDNYTVVDKKALIRTGSPDYKSIREVIPIGTYVEVTARSRQTNPVGKYMRVRNMTIEDGQMVAGEPIGWTAASNLIQGNSKVFFNEEWSNKKGPNAAWKSGKCIGIKVLVEIVGTGGQLQRIALDTMEAYLKMMEAAKEDGIHLSINSGFRTFAKQQSLFDWWQADTANHNRAAPAGRSNHQNGVAFDLNTLGFNTPNYLWMKENATSFGFIRTVNREHWHWEYQPEKAAEFKKTGKFKLPRVRK